MKLDDAISKRRSIREFSNKKVRWDHILEAIDAANQSPFAGNINNLQFLIISNKDKIARIAECAQQDWVADAPYIVIVCSTLKHLVNQYQDRGQMYSRQHAGAAIENFLLKIADLKLASCWVGAFTDKHLKDSLEIPKDYEIEAILPVGHPSKTSKVKHPKKIKLDNSVYWEEWGQRKKPTLANKI